MKIIADENLRNDLVRELRGAGHDVMSIREKFKGLSDEEIIPLVQNSDSILITEDKDFGEWVFAGKVSNLSVIFLRYNKEDYPTIKISLMNIVRDGEEKLRKKFITIRKNKIRVRDI